MSHDPTKLGREEARRLGIETLEIVRARSYRVPSGRTVAPGDLIERALRGTVEHRPEGALGDLPAARFDTRVELANVTTTEAARTLLVCRGAAGRGLRATSFRPITKGSGATSAGRT